MKDVPASRGYEGGFRVELMAKARIAVACRVAGDNILELQDLGLAQTASTEVKAPTPMGSLAHQLYRLVAKSPELREKDFSVLYQYLKDS
jgi:3-hydroxyisobutyrate dehydrogenase